MTLDNNIKYTLFTGKNGQIGIAVDGDIISFHKKEDKWTYSYRKGTMPDSTRTNIESIREKLQTAKDKDMLDKKVLEALNQCFPHAVASQANLSALKGSAERNKS